MPIYAPGVTPGISRKRKEGPGRIVDNRATIIGETTGGGAHPVSGHRIDDHFMIGVPFARAINPISKTNWEGTGVEPDVKVPAAEALATAQKLAAEKLVSK